jgi:hypothetical protein
MEIDYYPYHNTIIIIIAKKSIIKVLEFSFYVISDIIDLFINLSIILFLNYLYIYLKSIYIKYR